MPVRVPGLLPALLLVAGATPALTGCFGPSDAAAMPDAGALDQPEQDAGFFPIRPPPPLGRPPDGPPPPSMALDAGTATLSDIQIVCLGLDQPTCVSCHQLPGTTQLVLRPSHAPPPPPDMGVTPEQLQACGFASSTDADAGH
jgi:hypothetical protein